MRKNSGQRRFQHPSFDRVLYFFWALALISLTKSAILDKEYIIVMESSLPKLIVLLGPTASGKTAWGLEFAQKFNGDIISADSRQIYQKMTIGTAKPEGEWKWDGFGRTYFVNGIRHYLVDFLNPGKSFSASEFRDLAIKHARNTIKNGRVPMVVGGTGLYISTLIDNFSIPPVAANPKLRQGLEEKSLADLVLLLEKMDPETVKVIDKNNKRRLIRALEVCILSGEPFSAQRKKGEPLFDVLLIGIDTPRETLRERIETRVDAMIQAGIIKEIEILLKQKYGWQLPSMNGIGYRQFKDYFDGVLDLPATIAGLKRDTWQYARRQLTWFRREEKIKWVQTKEEAERLIAEFLQK